MLFRSNVPLSHLFPSVAQPPAYFFDFPTSAGPSGSPVSASSNHNPSNGSNGIELSHLDNFPTANSANSAELLADISADPIPSPSSQPVLPPSIPIHPSPPLSAGSFQPIHLILLFH